MKSGGRGTPEGADAGVDVTAWGKDQTVGASRENGVERSGVVPVDAIADAGAVERTCAPPPSTVSPKVRCLTIVFSIGRGACGRRLGGLVDDPPLPPPRRPRRPWVLPRALLRTLLLRLPSLRVPLRDDDEVDIDNDRWKHEGCVGVAGSVQKVQRQWGRETGVEERHSSSPGMPEPRERLLRTVVG